jgi:transcriptional repressor NrdR
VPASILEEAAREIEADLYALGEAEVESHVIGEMVMERLRQIDDVAYVRFASVYRQFADVDRMIEEIEALKEARRREEELRNQLQLPLQTM